MAEYSNISSMNEQVPQGTGQLSQADDHMRGIKSAIKNTLPALTGVVTASHNDLNSLQGYAASTGDVWDKIQANETWRGSITADQLNALSDIYKNSNQTIDTRLYALEVKLQDVDQAIITGALQDYNPADGTIKDRFIKQREMIDAIIGNETGVPSTSIANLVNTISGPNSILTWQLAREAAANNNQLKAIKSYHGAHGIDSYGYNRDLGHDFLKIVEKVAGLEFLASKGGEVGDVTWRQHIAALGNGFGGLNVTNAEDTLDTVGFIMTGLEPGTVVDIRFFDTDMNQGGEWLSQVNPDKLVRVSDTGEAWVSVRLGAAKDKMGPNGTRLEAGHSGFMTVRGEYIDANNRPDYVYRDTFCRFY